MNTRKVLAVARFEFVSAVARWSYWLVTFGVVLLIGVLGIFAMLVQSWSMAEQASRPGRFGLVDEAHVLGQSRGEILPGAIAFEGIADQPAALALLRDRAIDGFYVLAPDYLASGNVTSWAPFGAWPLSIQRVAAERALSSLLRQKLVHRSVPADVANRVREPVVLSHRLIRDDGRIIESSDPELAAIATVLIPVALAMLLSLALLGSTGALTQALALEKQHKIVEVLLSLARPDELLAGKLVGLGASGLLQIAVWGVLVLLGLGGATANVAPLLPLVSFSALWVAPIFFLAGYFFVGSLMLATAALASNATETQKLSAIWVLLVMLPFMLLGAVVFEPAGAVAQFLTWMPFSAPLAVTLRASIDPSAITVAEIIGPLALLLLCTWASLRIGARLFRIGLLLAGQRPPWREIFRQARLRK